jgi:hypothetical protein
MRPTAAESLRAIQAAVAGVMTPELTTGFALEAASAVGMMVESLAAEADTEVQTLVADSESLRELLGEVKKTLASNASAASLVSHIDGVIGQGGAGSLALSALAAEHNALLGALERFLVYAEDVQGTREAEAVAPARAAAYRHLKRVAVRGWSFFDVSGFREKILRARAENLT